MKKIELIKYLDDYLNIWEFKDSSKNWLQVDNSNEEIKKLGFAVDANTYIFDKAKQEEVDIVLSHHGIFWGFEQALVGVPYKRAKILMDNDIALYSAHLPLDAHKEVGNNIWLLRAFINIFWIQEGEYEIENFWDYNGSTIWFWLKLKHKMHVSNLVTPYAETMQLLKRFYNFWNISYFTSIAFISGWALSNVTEAKEKWYDIFVTWEWAHYEMTLAKELEQCILIWGHYETEKIWVKLLAYHLRDKFGIEIEFLDEKY